MKKLRTILLAGCGLLAAPSGALAQSAPTAVQVSLTNDGCTATPASISAGPVTFAVKNTGGDKVTEVELLKGDLIVGEKENLAPGLSGSFSVNVPAGDFSLYCPGAKTEKTPFKVAAAGGAVAAAPVDPQLKASLDQAADSYRQYVQNEVGTLVYQTWLLQTAVNSGDIKAAQSAYAPARLHYEAIEPVAESFGDLDPAIDMREDDADTPDAFTGFHRIEKALWQDNSLNGMGPVADQLLANVNKLWTLVNDPTQFDFDAADIANGSTELIDEVARTKVTGEEERYSKIDLLDMSANVAGSRRGFELLQPALQTIDPTLTSTIKARFAALDTVAAPLRRGDGWVTYDQLNPDQVKSLSQAVNDLAEPLSQVAAKVVVASNGGL